MSIAASQLGERIRPWLRKGLCTSRVLCQALQVSQPTLSRALQTLGDDLVVVGAARSIQYALLDRQRSHLACVLHGVSPEGQATALGQLLPVHPEGFVTRLADGRTLHSEGLPWWMHDMRPQGYLGRAFSHQHGQALGLPSHLSDWNDTHVLQALLWPGSDWPGHLVVGQQALQAFLQSPDPVAIPAAQRPARYAQLAQAAARGEHPGSSAGGEQPKFTAYAHTAQGPAHVLVKFSALPASPISQRWQDLLLAEHLALDMLRQHGLPAAKSAILRHGEQCFLEVHRFDRCGATGRLPLVSLASLDGEFLGMGTGGWPVLVRELAKRRLVQPEAVPATDLLWAFGVLIGNTDMHLGNLSFIAQAGQPCQLAPAYDMCPMAFSPGAGGQLQPRLPALSLPGAVPAQAWQQALVMAQAFWHTLAQHPSLSGSFKPCLQALSAHLQAAAGQVQRLGR